MRVTPRKVLWVVVVSAFILTIKDDLVAVLRDDALIPQELPVSQEHDIPPSKLDALANPEPGVGVPSVPAPPVSDPASEPLTPEEQEIHEWEALQAARKHLTNEICMEVREHADEPAPPPEVLFKYMAIDHVHKVIHCPYQGNQRTNNYKKALSWVAQSSLRVDQKSENYLGDLSEAAPPSFLQDLAQSSNSTDANGTAVTATDLEFGHNYTAEQFAFMKNTYHKIMFPDHPYERLLAVYDQKFTNRSDDTGVTLGRTIIRMSRPAAKWKEVTESEVYYHEYMNFVLKKKGTISDFMIYYDMCHVCDLQWDYIGKTDTYERDATHIVKAIQGEEFARHNSTSADIEMKAPEELQQHMAFMYKNITEYEMLRLYDDFSLDMYLFDYPWPFYNLTLMSNDPTKDGKYA